MFANMYKLALKRKPTPQSNPATKSQKYIRISKGKKYYVFLKSQVPTYQVCRSKLHDCTHPSPAIVVNLLHMRMHPRHVSKSAQSLASYPDSHQNI